MNARAVFFSCLALMLLASDLQAGDGVVLQPSKTPTPGEVRLAWTGGYPVFSVYRSTAPSGIVNPGNLLAQTADREWMDVPPPGTAFFYLVTSPCVAQPEQCDGADNDCDTVADEGCTACASDGGCGPGEYCHAAGVCAPDEPDGTVCARDAVCAGDHCQNGYCCASGDCCATSANCGAYATPSTCSSPSTCQGQRADGVCGPTFQCTAQAVADDSGCAGQISNSCGSYPSITCTSAQAQPSNQAALCASSCAGDGQCDGDAHCETNVCVPGQGNGASCTAPDQCSSGFCSDDTCCTSSCTGTCTACDLSGSAGTCTTVPSGQDPDAECGAQSCLGFYHSWSGDSCRRKADVSAAQATCGGSTACKTQGQECTAQTTVGPTTVTCNATCQDPNLATCTGTTAGTCINVNPGNQSCGLGACRNTVPQCANGAPNTCTPLPNMTTETCNDIDDNCDGTVDNGTFQDGLEPNATCSSFATLPQVGSNQTLTASTVTLYPSGDVDYFRINAVENDATCSCCDGFCTDEDFRLSITLTVPAGGGSYAFCTDAVCGNVAANCQTVSAGSSATWTFSLDGACPATDSYSVYVRVSGSTAPGFECSPYTLSYGFLPGCF